MAINLLSNEDAGIYIKKIIINKKEYKQKRKTSNIKAFIGTRKTKNGKLK